MIARALARVGLRSVLGHLVVARSGEGGFNARVVVGDGAGVPAGPPRETWWEADDDAQRVREELQAGLERAAVDGGLEEVARSIIATAEGELLAALREGVAARVAELGLCACEHRGGGAIHCATLHFRARGAPSLKASALGGQFRCTCSCHTKPERGAA